MRRRPHAPRPSPEQSELIDALGGPKRVAALVSPHIGRADNPLRPQTVSMWRARGIPYRYRLVLARFAGERGVSLPRAFLGDEQASPSSQAAPAEPVTAAEDDVPPFLREAL